MDFDEFAEWFANTCKDISRFRRVWAQAHGYRAGLARADPAVTNAALAPHTIVKADMPDEKTMTRAAKKFAQV